MTLFIVNIIQRDCYNGVFMRIDERKTYYYYEIKQSKYNIKWRFNSV